MERQTPDKVITFGKHKGKSISQICEQEPNYIEWCVSNIPEFYIYSDDLLTELNKFGHKTTAQFISLLKIKDDKYYSTVIEKGTRSMEIWGEMMHLTGWSWQTHLPKLKNDKAFYKDKIELLINNWAKVGLDTNFIENTYPIKFTGRKGRRLVVKKKINFTPPWGSWYDHLKNGKPSKFTELRKKINEFINPMKIDHIDFVD